MGFTSQDPSFPTSQPYKLMVSRICRSGMHAKLLHLGPNLCNLIDCSLPGFSVHGILQARLLEWLAISSCRGSSRLRDRTQVSYVSCFGRWVLYQQCHLGSPVEVEERAKLNNWEYWLKTV